MNNRPIMRSRALAALARTYRAAMFRPVALAGRTRTVSAEEYATASAAAADARGAARYLAAHAVGWRPIDRAEFLRACGMHADAATYDDPSARRAAPLAYPIPGATVPR